jgi:hypothetical protein
VAYNVPPPENLPESGFYYHFKHDPDGPVNNYAYYTYGLGYHTEDDCRPENAFMQVYRPLYEDAYAFLWVDCCRVRVLAGLDSGKRGAKKRDMDLIRTILHALAYNLEGDDALGRPARSVKFLEAEGAGYTIRLPANSVLQSRIGQDGGVKTDAFLNDPRDRHFDPAAVQSYRDGIPAPAFHQRRSERLARFTPRAVTRNAGPHWPSPKPSNQAAMSMLASPDVPSILG